MTRVVVRRFTDQPIIHSDLFSGPGGGNINGPSLIAAPAWFENPLGRFYLYFGHHRGDYIRLGVADRLEGPWSLVEGGTLPLGDASACRDHIASPDVHIDHDRREIVMFFHGVGGDGRQMTYLARSSDGITFEADPTPRAAFYFRTVRWRDSWIGMSKGGVLYVSDTLTGNYQRLPRPAFSMRDPDANAVGDVRHVALDVEGDGLRIYHSRIGDAPERILLAQIDLALPREQWVAKRPEAILAPQRDWEGRNLPLKPSEAGPARGPENALRDPAIFSHEGRTYLLYSGSGESNIGIVELTKGTSFLDRLTARSERKSRGTRTHGPLATLRFRDRKIESAGEAGGEIESGAEVARSLQAEARKRLREPGALSRKLAEIDAVRAFRRLYVMGCGRSGTWLLTAAMSTFDDVEIFACEVEIEHFGSMQTDRSALILKRSYEAYQRIHEIPDPIEIVYAIRHPFDVLTSLNPNYPQSAYHISPDRWLGEMLALQYLVDTGRKNTLIVRYEDLVAQPQRTQARIASALTLTPRYSMDEIERSFAAPEEAVRAMHGQRPIDTQSMNKFRHDPAKIDYLKHIRPRLGRLLTWVAETCDYDISL